MGYIDIDWTVRFIGKEYEVINEGRMLKSKIFTSLDTFTYLCDPIGPISCSLLSCLRIKMRKRMKNQFSLSGWDGLVPVENHQ